MGRQYIGIEQMDYIEDIAVKRMQKVIGKQTKKDGELLESVDFDNGGISKSVNWNGGGEFIYFELAKWNETAKDKINECKNIEELIKLFDELYEKYFLNYNLKIKEFKEQVTLEQNFKNLDLNKQKEMFLTMLDLNQMYVNKSEMKDSKYGLNKQEQALTQEFYGDK
jgi:adenine-specific DNA-methyltransferase